MIKVEILDLRERMRTLAFLSSGFMVESRKVMFMNDITSKFMLGGEVDGGLSQLLSGKAECSRFG